MHKPKRKSRVVRVADMIATFRGKLVLIRRLRAPFGLALPGGHIDRGETPKEAAIREFKEETGLDVTHVRFFIRKSGKRRDPRYKQSTTYVYTGDASGEPKDEKGFTEIVIASTESVRTFPNELFAFDHAVILKKYLAGAH